MLYVLFLSVAGWHANRNCATPTICVCINVVTSMLAYLSAIRNPPHHVLWRAAIVAAKPTVCVVLIINVGANTVISELINRYGLASLMVVLGRCVLMVTLTSG